jgi:hypothetical protein
MAATDPIAHNPFAHLPPVTRDTFAVPAAIDTDPRMPCMEGHQSNDSELIHVARDLAASERRSFARYAVRGEWRVHDLSCGRVVGVVCDIGLGGVRIEAPEPIPPARRYPLSIELRVDDAERPCIEVIARCAWHRARPDLQFEAGFEFVEMTPSTRGLIAQYIDQFGL